MNDTSSPKPKWNFKIIALLIAVFVSILWFSGCGNAAVKLEKICKAEARVIIYDQMLWKEYEAAVKKQYLKKKKINPQAKLSLLDYVPGFESIYYELNAQRFSEPNEIIRDDKVISKNKKILARFVNYSVQIPKFGRTSFPGCIRSHDELYSTKEFSYE